MDDILNAVHKKVNKIYKGFDDPNADTKKELFDFLQWITGDRSLQQLKMFWKFIEYLHENVGAESENLKNFKDRLFVNMKLYEVLYKGPAGVFLQPESVAFGNCSQKRFNEIFSKVQEFAQAKLQIDYSDWSQYYMQNEGLI